MTQTSHGATALLDATWDFPTLSKAAPTFTTLGLPRGLSLVDPDTRAVPAPTSVKVCTYAQEASRWNFLLLLFHVLLTWLIDYIHYITTNPTNLQMYGMCSKDTKVALHLGDGTDIIAQNGFTGGWNPGGDVGRFTT